MCAITPLPKSSLPLTPHTEGVQLPSPKLERRSLPGPMPVALTHEASILPYRVRPVCAAAAPLNKVKESNDTSRILFMDISPVVNW